MSRFIVAIASFIEERTRAQFLSLGDSTAELRTVFHGPPIGYLRQVLAHFAETGGVECTLANSEKVVCPVLLLVESTFDNTTPLSSSMSGLCTNNQLIAVRNTPEYRRWIALSAPGLHDGLSVLGATDEFGIGRENSSSAASVSDWYNDAFVSRLIDAAIGRHSWKGESEERDARELLHNALGAAANAAGQDALRERSWALLARVSNIVGVDKQLRQEWSLACGVPPSNADTLRASTQTEVLEKLIERILSDGFGGTSEQLKLLATSDEAIAIDAMIANLRGRASVPIALEQAPQFYYTDSALGEQSVLPDWWSVLGAERLVELLGDDAPSVSALSISIGATIVPAGRGLPAVVASIPELIVAPPVGASGSLAIELLREGAGRGNGRTWQLSASGATKVVDDTVPPHVRPLRYVASAAGQRSASARVVVLDQWAAAIVITSRTAAKLSLPKKPKHNATIAYELSLTMLGEGRHFLDVHVASGARLGERALGVDASTVGAAALVSDIARPAEDSGGPWGLEIEASAECYYDIPVIGVDGQDYLVRLNVSCEEADIVGCRSEFERLVRLHASGGTLRSALEVQLDRQVRTADLQSWLLEESNCQRSFYPIVIAADCGSAWSAPNWHSSAGTVLSRGQFLYDPRPQPEEFQPPEEFLAARKEIASRVRGEDGHGVMEAAELGAWMSDPAFAEVADAYVRSYAHWLEDDPNVASWVDVVLVTGVEQDGALSQEPYALLLNPLHPLRFGWHALAQRSLLESLRSKHPCPAASILDANAAPDAFALALRTATGSSRRVLFLSTESSSEYWPVLWSASQIASLSVAGARSPFDRELGVQIGGIARGFSVSQVKKAMDDVSLLFAAKPILNLLVTSSTSNGSACNDGIMTWARTRFAADEETNRVMAGVGSRELHVFDERRPPARPEEPQVANLSEDTAGAVRWFEKAPSGARPDLGIIAQLETSNPSASETTTASPLGRGALIRHRIRTQLRAGSGAFLTESRMGTAGPPSGDALADHLATLVARIENLTDKRLGYTFAPSIKTIHQVLKERHAEYVAVSSSALDPACFLGGWLDDAYLWDYELPAYSHRAGDTSGYYLLSRVRPLDFDALRRVLARLPECQQLGDNAIQDILLEVARRGMPTVRGMSAGHSGASGDLGLFLAGRLLQDAFRSVSGQSGLLDIMRGNDEAQELVLVVPVDPFKGYLHDLQRAAGEPSLKRPDLVVFGLTLTASRVACKITPVEVKYRQDQLSAAASKDALAQATALSQLLKRIRVLGSNGALNLWALGGQHLLLSLLDFGFRVYSQREEAKRESSLWTRLHQRVSEAILADQAEVEIDDSGRLIIFDACAMSQPLDVDSDGFAETVTISPLDASRIVRDDAAALYVSMRSALGTWRMTSTSGGVEAPSDVAPITQADPSDGGLSQVDETSSAGAPRDSVLETPDAVTETASLTSSDSAAAPVHVAVAAVPPLDVDPPRPVNREEAEKTQEEANVIPCLGGEETLPIPSESDLTPARARYPRGIEVRVGSSVDGFGSEAAWFLPNVTDLNQLNIGVVGDLGTGKTQLVKSLIYQMRTSVDANDSVAPRFLIFDYKRDYQQQEFVDAVGARVVEPYRLPLNLFDTTGVTRKPSWMPRFQFFADVLDKIYGGIGPVQHTNLRSAVKAACEGAAALGRQATIYDVERQYETVVGGKVDAPLAIMKDITTSELFDAKPLSSTSFDAFFDGVVVISLADLGQDDHTKNLVVAIFLNLFYEFMLRLPKRGFRGSEPQLRTVDSYLLIDEADNIMKYEFDVLKSILLQGREFGVGVLMASQYLKHFKVHGTDYREPLLTWCIHKVPNLLPQELGALGLTDGLPQLCERVKHLKKHQLLYKTAGVPARIVSGTPFYELQERHRYGE